MRVIYLALIIFSILVLFYIFYKPLPKDHFADQVVHAGVGGIAGPLFDVEAYDNFYKKFPDDYLDK
jgi:hypothetical protein